MLRVGYGLAVVMVTGGGLLADICSFHQPLVTIFTEPEYRRRGLTGEPACTEQKPACRPLTGLVGLLAQVHYMLGGYLTHSTVYCVCRGRKGPQGENDQFWTKWTNERRFHDAYDAYGLLLSCSIQGPMHHDLTVAIAAFPIHPYSIL